MFCFNYKGKLLQTKSVSLPKYYGKFAGNRKDSVKGSLRNDKKLRVHEKDKQTNKQTNKQNKQTKI